ncbi:calmodulin-binding receptor-like cytoplasmic kinase 2 [Cucurbita pepo subsp. pepo]|uniref:calmodulin-binding receptor-like cytoplasmic kinase 2 n=1 Tax=Cucurbita pepo subsp. pepo TaxID=3664 RepID=UPI000C9D28C2|nr:calmodulin-binding receptor-like cytoplasmic kinase 2 [Cucurbita pepo subsp. pepo]
MTSSSPWHGGERRNSSSSGERRYSSSSGERRNSSSVSERRNSCSRGSRSPYLSYLPSPDVSAGMESRSRLNPVKAAARSVAGAFITCFTPPEKETSPGFGIGREFRHSSDASSHNSKRNQGSRRETHFSSNLAAHDREPGSLRISIEEIRKATKNFSASSKIGQGGFGAVYKGKLDGVLVAIKRAKKSVYDNNLGGEFQSEIQTLAQVEHLNLVKFYGYLEHEDERIVIVEYVPNGTLREHLECIHGTTLDLATRLDIATDVAHAITYLHMYTDRPIIHRDIKSSNILLTENYRAKVADFGFARLAADGDATHVSTQVKGTAGYLDPEYLKTYQLTEKSDTYSFGVLLVELVTGRRPIEPKRVLDQRITPKWAMKKFHEGKANEILDPNLEQTAANHLAVEKILELTLQCLAPRRQSRPSMRRCAEILWSIRKDHRDLSAPDFRSFSTSSRRSASVSDK